MLTSVLRNSLVAVAVAALPPAALARHHVPLIDVVVPVAPVVVEPACPPPVWVEPVYRTVVERQWVEPVVQTVTAQVWVPPAISTATQPVFVPDQFGWRSVVSYDGWGRPHRSRQYVLLAPVHYADPLVVTPGRYAGVPQQQVVCEGHWTTVERQELVSPGHCESPSVDVPACPPHRRLRLRLPF